MGSFVPCGMGGHIGVVKILFPICYTLLCCICMYCFVFHTKFSPFDRDKKILILPSITLILNDVAFVNTFSK